MSIACTGTAFYQAFKQNMEALGLDVPSSWYGTQTTLLTRVGALVAAVDRLGRDATLAELIGSTTLPEKLLAAGGIYAAWYVDAAVGSLMVATGKFTQCSSSTDISRAVQRFQFEAAIRVPSSLLFHLQAHPEIFDDNAMNRLMYARRGLSTKQPEFAK
ncbi:hypothetical protein J6350_28565 [Burkholderia pseudomallei]|nr:hypothetical protein [Burkholderia pseudomallei]MBO3034982.1 hypothetical protein [Burkholderia pseudomallei]MBO7849070.1 hypothetical protein [Burkholderia pseudomallei]